jgi:multicomponent Na+:H+ antiporter subunit B
MQGMSPIVKNITRLVAGFIALYGAYTVLYGHVTPGGGFSGGVVLASGLVLVVLAFGVALEQSVLSDAAAKLGDSLGALLFLAVAFLGYGAGIFFVNLLPSGETGRLASAGTIPISNIAIGIKVGAGLLSLFVALAVFRRYPAEQRSDTGMEA